MESDGSRSGSSLSLRNIVGGGGGGAGTGNSVATGGTGGQSPSHHRVHRSISATNSKPSRRASGGESLRESIASHAAGAQLTVSVSNVTVCSPCRLRTVTLHTTTLTALFYTDHYYSLSISLSLSLSLLSVLNVT